VHVGRAARKIGLSQPAASHALKRLRGLLSDPVLVRVGTRMELTPRAARLRESVSETLWRVQALLETDSFDPASSSRQFSVMMQDHVGHLIVPPLVGRLHANAPLIRFTFLPWQSPSSLRLQRTQAIDLVISCSTGEIPGFQREELFGDSEITVLRQGHPTASRMQSLGSFLKAKHVAVVGLGITEDPVDTWLRQEGFARQIALRVPSYLQALQAVAQSNLVAFVPKRLAHSLAKQLSLVLVPSPINPGQYIEYIHYPRRAVQDPGSIWLRNAVLKVGKDLGPLS
jgi:DNA-binding transcriptional LysR family regulator